MRFSRLVSLISLTVLCALGLVIVSSWATRHAIGGGQRFSAGLRKSVLALAEFPTQAKSLVSLLNNYLPPKGASNIYSNHLESSSVSNGISGFLLVSCISSNGANAVSLINLSDRSSRVIGLPINKNLGNQYSDVLIGSEPRRQSSFSSRHRVWNPYISKDGILTYIIPWNDLISVDLKTGQEKWRVRGAFHHSIEADWNGNFWVCGAAMPGSITKPTLKNKHANDVFQDQILVHVSRQGKILKTLSVADLLIDSGLEYLLYGVSNPGVNFDPIHLNQVTPINTEAGVFRKGQILVSLRNLSTILLVDTTINQVVWHRCGPWMNQHCVFPIGESKFSVLDNHSFASGEYWLYQRWKTKIIKHDLVSGNSEEVDLNFKEPTHFKIPIEGRAVLIAPETWMIEDCIHGTIMILANGELVFKWTNHYPDGSVGVTSWCRYLQESEIPNKL